MTQLIGEANKITPKANAHPLLSHIRQAVQTALYIAQQHALTISAFHRVTTHPLVQALQEMDAIIKAVWIDPTYGAKNEDRGRDAMWQNLATIGKVTGVAIGVAGVAGAAYYADQNPLKVRKAKDQATQYLGNIGTNVQKTISGGVKYVSDAGQQLGKDTTALIDTLLPQPSAAEIAKYKAQDAAAWLKNLGKPKEGGIIATSAYQPAVNLNDQLSTAENAMNYFQE